MVVATLHDRLIVVDFLRNLVRHVLFFWYSWLTSWRSRHKYQKGDAFFHYFWDFRGCKYTVKLARAKLPDTAKTFAGNCRILHSPGRNLDEAFFCARQGGFFQSLGRLFLSSTKHFDQNSHLLLSKSMVKLSNWFCPKKLDCSMLAVQSVHQKNTAHWKSLHYRQLDPELSVFLFFIAIKWRPVFLMRLYFLARGCSNIDWWASAVQCNSTSYVCASSCLASPQVMIKETLWLLVKTN